MTATNAPQQITKEEAIERFKQLIGQYGIQWTAAVPREAFDALADCNRVLNADDRRRALGLH
jgi:hypothetical protein